MRISIWGKMLLLGIGMTSAFTVWGQTQEQIQSPASRLDVAVTFDMTRATVVPGSNFWMQGGSIQLKGQFWRGLAEVAQVTGHHTSDIHGNGVGLDLITATFGPRYTLAPKHRRVEIFGQALAGQAWSMNTVIPYANATKSRATSLAVEVGGGLDVPLSHRLLLRAFEAHWLYTQMPNAGSSAQNNLRLGAGLVVRFP